MDILELRSILQEKTTGMQKTNVYGTCHLVYPDSSDTSYNVSQLTPTAALEVLKVPNAEELDHFNNPQDLIVGVRKSPKIDNHFLLYHFSTHSLTMRMFYQKFIPMTTVAISNSTKPSLECLVLSQLCCQLNFIVMVMKLLLCWRVKIYGFAVTLKLQALKVTAVET